MTIANWRRNAGARLSALHGERATALLEADVLLSHLLEQSRTWLFAHSDVALEPIISAKLDAALQRRLEGEPIAYITGQREFRSRNYRVTAAVLVPRDDTEVLVEVALDKIRERLNSAKRCRVLEAGTGSGIIATSLALEIADTNMWIMANDIDSDALVIARENAASLGADVTFIQGSWLTSLAPQTVDFIVSNPPYIVANDPHLEALKSEPQHALVSGSDGLDAIRELITDARSVLADGGWLLLEHGHDQGKNVRELLNKAGYKGTHSRQDLAGHERVTTGRLTHGYSTQG